HRLLHADMRARSHGGHRHLGVERMRREDVDEVRLEAQEFLEAPHELRRWKERGSAVEQILAAIAERHDHRVQLVAVAERVQVEDAAEPDDADSQRTGHGESRLASNMT